MDKGSSDSGCHHQPHDDHCQPHHHHPLIVISQYPLLLDDMVIILNSIIILSSIISIIIRSLSWYHIYSYFSICSSSIIWSASCIINIIIKTKIVIFIIIMFTIIVCRSLRGKNSNSSERRENWGCTRENWWSSFIFWPLALSPDLVEQVVIIHQWICINLNNSTNRTF